MDTAPFPRLLTTTEAARILRCTGRQVQKLAEEGKIPAVKIGSRWKIRETELLALVEGRGGSAPLG